MDNIKQWKSPDGSIHTGSSLSTLANEDVIQCETCHFKHVIPLPDDEALRKFYEEEFYQTERQEYFAGSEADASWLHLMFDLRLDRLSETLATDQATLRILDVGCGPGDFLMAVKKRGWDGVGIEPSPLATDYANNRGLSVTQGFFTEETARSLGKFDGIHLSEVLEHIADPMKVVGLAQRQLKPGGMLIMSVPNDFNPFQETLVEQDRAKQWWVAPNHHLNYFNFESLEALVAAKGLNVTGRSTNFPMDMFLLMGQNYSTDPQLGKTLHGWRKKFDLSFASPEKRNILNAFYDALAKAGLGRLAIVFAQRPY